MTEVLWHGRGGQGAFTAAKLLGAAYSLADKINFALAFPSFGPERRGAPILAFTRLDQKQIGNRSQIKKADYNIFLDDTLFNESALEEIKDQGKILLNTRKPLPSSLESDSRIITFDADTLAMNILKMPVSNTVMLSVFAVESTLVSAEDLKKALQEYMNPRLYEKNAIIIDEVFRMLGGNK